MAKPQGASLDFQNTSRITNLPDAVAAQEPATFAQLNAAIEGLNWKDSCRAATQSNVSIASPGATVDGVTMATGDRVLVRAQTAGAENGIYIWNGAAVAMTRSTDMNAAAEVEQAVTVVEEGTSAGVSYRQTAVNVTLNTTTLPWIVFGASVPAASETTAGIAEIATQAETDAGTDDARFITPLKFKTSPLSRKAYTATFGDGSSTSFTITHNLGTKAVQVGVYETGGSFREVDCEVQHTSGNTVTVLYAPAAASNALTAVITA